MKPYDELLKQIPQGAWQYVEAEYEEDDEGESSIQFYWDEDEHPELAPLSQLTEDQWEDFVITSLQRAIDNDDASQDDSESGDSDDREGGELD